jgi:hypothetical protein
MGFSLEHCLFSTPRQSHPVIPQWTVTEKALPCLAFMSVYTGADDDACVRFPSQGSVRFVRRVLPPGQARTRQVESDTSCVMGTRSIATIGMFHRSSVVSSKRSGHGTLTLRFHSPNTTVGYLTAHVLPCPTPPILRIFSGEGGRVGYLGSP